MYMFVIDFLHTE